MYKLYCRTYQKTFRLISPLIPWIETELLEGEGGLQRLPSLVKSKGISRVLVVTDHGIVSAGLLKRLQIFQTRMPTPLAVGVVRS
ncbi:hypothetical protein RZN25_09615 [Bacillaceae bacterium S4-13-56]